MTFHIYHADCIGEPSNCSYPHADTITDAGSLTEAVKKDYVCAEYKNHYRSNENFIGSDCLPVDCDNDHTENPEDWIYPSDVAQAFPNVAFAVHYSRHHMKEKNGKAPRPKFHVFFPIDPMHDPEEYSGFAFGVGLERITLLKYEIDDMRLLYENDIRFLKQF